MAEIVKVDAFEDAGDDDPSAINRDEEEKTTESTLEGRWGSSGCEGPWAWGSGDWSPGALPPAILFELLGCMAEPGAW